MDREAIRSSSFPFLPRLAVPFPGIVLGTQVCQTVYAGWVKLAVYRRTSISGTKKAQITFPLRHFFPAKGCQIAWKSKVK
jgi:hypothetical protein